MTTGFPDGSDSKESACNARDPSSIPHLGISPAEGNGNPLQYSCLEKAMNRGAGGLQCMGSQKELGTTWSLNNNNRAIGSIR